MLVFEISREDNVLKMGAAERGATLRHYGEVTISVQEIEALCDDVTTVLNKASQNGLVSNDLTPELKKVGQLLFEQLLTLEVKQTIRNTADKDLLLSLDERVVQIPWELLHDGTEFLCLKFACGRNVKTRGKFYEAKAQNHPTSLKALILADPTGDLKAAYQEGIALRNQLERCEFFNDVRLKASDVEAQYVKMNIRDHDVVHFSGHAEHDVEHPSESGWVFKDSRVTAKDIVTLGSGASFPSFVFSNACQSGQTGEWNISRDFEQEVFGLANAFLLAGTKHYVGTFWRVIDEASAVFAREFYKQSASNTAIGEAIRLGRIHLLEKYGAGSIVWASYVLYGDPTSCLIAAPGSSLHPHTLSLKLKRQTLVPIAVGLFLAIVGGSWVVKNHLAHRRWENDQKNLSAWDQLDYVDKSVRLRDFNSASAFVEQALAKFRKAPTDEDGVINALRVVAAIHLVKGELPAAKASLDEVLRTSEKLKDARELATTHEARGLLFERMGQYETAEKEYREARGQLPPNSVPVFEAASKFDLGSLSYKRGDPEAALKYYAESLEVYKGPAELPPASHFIKLMAGYVAFKNKRYDVAVPYFKQSIESEEGLDREVLIMANLLLGRMSVLSGDVSAAKSYVEKAQGYVAADSMSGLGRVVQVMQEYIHSLQPSGETVKGGSVGSSRADDSIVDKVVDEVILESDAFHRIWFW